jgi:predicted phage terminase large subunit-like protein
MLQTLYGVRERQHVVEEMERCEQSLSYFISRAWPVLKPMEPYVHNWHIDTVCEQLERVSADEVKRLQIWVPPGTMKTLIVSVFWPAWEWIKNPWLRYWGASYEVRLSGRMAAMSRDLMMSHWWRERWGDRFKFTREGENYYGNDMGGTRLATAPNSTGSGEHGHRILIDDPINAKAADATSRATLNEANDWYDGTVVTRGIGLNHARVIIMQRLHEEDLAAHVLESEEWEVLCLPERYEPDHPFVWPDDPRKEEGELLWPSYRDDRASNALAGSLTPHRAAGQLQQRPAAREGDILQVSWWRFYDPRIRSQERWDELPNFSMVVMSLDCPQKDKETNDNVAIQAWGVHGVSRYLLDLRLGKMNYPQAKRATIEMSRWSRTTWPRARQVILIENTGYGSDLIIDLKEEFTGVTKINPQQDGDKVVRADAASDSLSSGHCLLPGFGPPWRPPVYEASNTPADVADFIHNCARFPNATHDDDVDSWSQMVNWLRGKQTGRVRTSSAVKRARQGARDGVNAARHDDRQVPGLR